MNNLHKVFIYINILIQNKKSKKLNYLIIFHQNLINPYGEGLHILSVQVKIL